MNLDSFHLQDDDDGHCYALASCHCRYQGQAVKSTVVLYFSPTDESEPFSWYCWGTDGQRQMFHRGPDYSPAPEAALLDFWVQEGVPAYAWQLVQRPAGHRFPNAEHEASYLQARKALCRALYGLRAKAATQTMLNVAPLLSPPEGGYAAPDAFASTEENAEILGAML